MPYILFIAYLLLFSWLITKSKFIANSGISKKLLVTLFLLKVFAGVAYGWMYSRIPEHHIYADTWRFFYEGGDETDLLFNNPAKYFTDIFYNPYKNGYEKFFSNYHSYWSDLKNNFMVKLVSVFNIFSLKHYYVNVVFYSFLTFFGPVALYRVFNKIFTDKKNLLIIGCFLTPSFLYWCSGLHKDGFIFMSIALVMYHLDKILSEEGFTFKRGLYIFLCLLFILPMRNYVVLGLLPAVTAWVLAEKIKQKKWVVFSAVYFVCSIFFFTSRFIHPKLNLPLSVSMRQDEFINLKGNSFIPTKKLLPGFKSFIKNLPEAINHSLFRPYPGEAKSFLYIPASIEVVLYVLLFVCWFFWGENIFSHSSVLFGFFFSISLLLIIGYTIPFIGAIVRYRSILLPFMITPMLCSISIKKRFSSSN